MHDIYIHVQQDTCDTHYTWPVAIILDLTQHHTTQPNKKPQPQQQKTARPGCISHVFLPLTCSLCADCHTHTSRQHTHNDNNANNANCPLLHTHTHIIIQNTTTNKNCSLTHPLQVLETGAATRDNTKLKGRPYRVQSVLVTELLVLQLGLGCRTNLMTGTTGNDRQQQTTGSTHYYSVTRNIISQGWLSKA